MVRLFIDQVAKLFVPGDANTSLHAIRRATVIDGEVQVEVFDALVPCTLYLWPGPASYTRSQLTELHTIGSPPVLEAILAALTRCHVRLAEPGEFTLRAFLAGRMDLTQAEAVLRLVATRH